MPNWLVSRSDLEYAGPPESKSNSLDNSQRLALIRNITTKARKHCKHFPTAGNILLILIRKWRLLLPLRSNYFAAGYFRYCIIAWAPHMGLVRFGAGQLISDLFACQSAWMGRPQGEGVHRTGREPAKQFPEDQQT
jgi:hypothetical protein